MVTSYFIKGMLIGISIAAPVGPIGVLCIKRTLSEGRMAGFLTGLGAAFADAFYGAVAAFGLTIVTGFLTEQQFIINLGGGLFLLYLGVKMFLSKPATQEKKIESKGLFSHFFSTFFLTLTNPATILSFIAVFAGFGLGIQSTDHFSSSAIVAGVLIGSALWWLILSFAMSMLKSAINSSGLIWINRLSGMLIISFGVWSLYSCFR